MFIRSLMTLMLRAPEGEGDGGSAADPKPGEGGEQQPAPKTGDGDQQPQTVLTTDPKDDKGTASLANWPDDWRARLAGGDEKALKRLERFADPSAVWKSFREAEGKLSSGKVQTAKPPAADAPAEELAAWRKDNGIPEAPADYLKNLPDGLVIGKADKPQMEQFAADMHARHASPEVVHAAIASYYAMRETAAAEAAGRDAQAMRTTEDELRADWGADYRRNVNAIVGWLDTADADVKGALMNARGPDGTPVMSMPKVLRWLHAQALDINPAATIVPGAGANAGKGIEDRIGEIETVMRKDNARYVKDAGMQRELLDLYAARDRMKQKAA